MSEKLNELKTREEQQKEEEEIVASMKRYGWSREVAEQQYKLAEDFLDRLNYIVASAPDIFGDYT